MQYLSNNILFVKDNQKDSSSSQKSPKLLYPQIQSGPSFHSSCQGYHLDMRASKHDGHLLHKFTRDLKASPL